MGRDDLGTCVLISSRDVNLMNIDFDNLEKVEVSESRRSCSSSGDTIYGCSKKALKYIERIGRRVNADLAVIGSKVESFSRYSYDFEFYRYK